MTQANNFMWILLAAGNSTRLGEPKQLLCLGGQSLVACQVQRLLHTQLPVCVIEGAVELVGYLPQHEHLHILQNPHWQQGIGSSIHLAVTTYTNYHLGFVLVDQFGIDTLQLLRFYDCWRSDKALVQVSLYKEEDLDAWGAPVIMHQSICKQFAQCAATDDKSQGLKPWLTAHKETLNMSMLPWPEAAQDLDTIAQWQTIQHHTSWKELI